MDKKTLVVKGLVAIGTVAAGIITLIKGSKEGLDLANELRSVGESVVEAAETVTE